MKRVELIQNGFNQLAGADKEKLFELFSTLDFNKQIEIYVGKAAEMINMTLEIIN
jgi:hypothetical protein